jgi:hypothetical protein
MRLEATLGQTALQRHLTAFKANLVIATRAGFLAFVTTAGRFAKA